MSRDNWPCAVNSVFNAGAVLLADGDTIHLYYGAGDSCVTLATGSVRELLAWLEANSSAGDAATS